MRRTPIQRAIDTIGQTEMAERLGVTIGFISNLYNGRKPVPATRVLQIEEACNERVSRYELRPDVFGKKPKGVK